MADEKQPEASQPTAQPVETQPQAVTPPSQAVQGEPPLEAQAEVTPPPVEPKKPQVRVITHTRQEDQEYEDRIRRETRESARGARSRDDHGGRVNRRRPGGYEGGRE